MTADPANNKPLHLVSLGEVLVEFSRRQDGAYMPAVAGDVFNTSFYASRLGLRVGLVTAVGVDMFTPLIVAGMEREHIDTACVQRLDDRRNGLYFIEVDQSGERSFDFRRDASAATQTLARCHPDTVTEYVASSEYFLLTGVALSVMRDSFDALANLLRAVKGRTQIVFDTNYRAGLWDSPRRYLDCVEAIILPFADILLPTDADLSETWVATGRAQNLEDAVRHVASFGAGKVVMKAGEHGCAIWENDVLQYHPVPATPSIMDTTGAGDAFNAGFIAGRIAGMDLEASCKLAQQTAARALEVSGAVNPFF